MKTIPVSELPNLITNLQSDKKLILKVKLGWCNVLIVDQLFHIRRIFDPRDLQLENLPCVYELEELYNSKIIKDGRYLTYDHNEDKIQIVSIGISPIQTLTFEIDIKDKEYKETLVKILKSISDDLYFFYVERIKVEI